MFGLSSECAVSLLVPDSDTVSPCLVLGSRSEHFYQTDMYSLIEFSL